MELKVFQDEVPAAAGVYEMKTELPVETEILIPDYLPQVFKIVKCLVWFVALNKQVMEDRVTLEGYLRCVVYYQSDLDQSLCQTEQKLPFTRSLEMRGWEGTPGAVSVSGEAEYLNCRAVNQRRVDIRGAYAVRVRVPFVKQQKILTGLEGGEIQQKKETLSLMKAAACLDKRITAEDEVEFPAPPLSVLDISGLGQTEEIKLISGKAVVKGRVSVQVLYRTQPGYRLEKLEKDFPFHQILDLEDLPENCQCFASAELVGSTLRAGSGPENTAAVTVPAMLHLRAFCPVEYQAVSDAYSTRFETQLEEQTVQSEELADTLDQDVECQVSGALPDENAEILECFAVPSVPELIQDGQRLELHGRATAHIFCMNSLGEIDCYDKTFEYTLPGTYTGSAADYRAECWCAVRAAQAEKKGKEVQAQITLAVTGMVWRRQSRQVLSGAACGEALPEPTVALRIYYAKKGEEIFEIAKRYHVAPQAVLEGNGLEESRLEEDCRLLVPSQG